MNHAIPKISESVFRPLKVYVCHTCRACNSTDNSSLEVYIIPFDVVCWLFLGLTALLDSILVYIGPSPKEREKEERKER